MPKRNRTLRRIWTAIGQFFTLMLTALQAIAGSLLLMCAACVYVSPAHWPLASIITLGFPFFLCGSLLTGLLALLFTPRRVWITLLALLLSSGCIRNFVPVNLPSTPPDSAWHIVSWNVGGTKWDDSARQQLRDYLGSVQADFLVAQELTPARGDSLQAYLHGQLPYVCFAGNTNDYGQVLLSRWPIVGSRLLVQNGGNCAAVYYVKAPLADTLFVVNCHLQSMRLSQADRSGYAEIVSGGTTDPDSLEHTSSTLLARIKEQSAIRALQADTLARFLAAHAGRPLILAGDLNATPVSYTRQTLVEAAPLTDCFRAAGNGLGRSFNRDAIFVRIDHLICSTEHFKPYACRFDTTRLSDHFPLYCRLAPKQAAP